MDIFKDDNGNYFVAMKQGPTPTVGERIYVVDYSTDEVVNQSTINNLFIEAAEAAQGNSDSDGFLDGDGDGDPLPIEDF